MRERARFSCGDAGGLIGCERLLQQRDAYGNASAAHVKVTKPTHNRSREKDNVPLTAQRFSQREQLVRPFEIASHDVDPRQIVVDVHAPEWPIQTLGDPDSLFTA